jgi:hypothetical protein
MLDPHPANTSQSLFKLGLRLVIGVWLTGSIVAAQPQHPAIPDGIRIIGRDDPRFMEMLKSTFPTVAADPDLQKLLPVMYIVRNDSDIAVRAYTIRWESTDHRPSTTRKQPVIFYSEYVARPSEPSPVYGELPILRPHRSQLVLQNERFAPPGEADLFTTYPRPLAPLLGNDPLLEQEGTGEVSFVGKLDYVLMDDGRAGGPDSKGFAGDFGAMRSAERDEGLAILPMLTDGSRMDKIHSVLQHDTNQGDLYSAPTHLLSVYEAEKRTQARRLMLQIDHGKQDNFQRIVKTLAEITNEGPSLSVTAERHRASAPILRTFDAADIVVSGQIHPGDANCPRPQQNGIYPQSCVAYLKIRHSYKGPEWEGKDLRIEYQFNPQGRSPVGMLASNGFFIFFGCTVNAAYQNCPNSGPIRMSPVVSASPTAQGLDLIAADAVAGLSSPNEEEILWSASVIGAFDIQVPLDKLKAAKAAVKFNNALFIDALLVRGGDYADAKPDLELAMTMPEMMHSPDLFSLVQAMSASPSPAMLDELALFSKSQRNDVRQLALKLLESYPNETSIAAVQEMLDDPEPVFAYSATKVLESRTKVTFKDKPAFAQFVKSKEIRDAYIAEWKLWIANSGTH